MKNKISTILDTKIKKIVAMVLVVIVLGAGGFGIYALTVNNEIIVSLKKDLVKTVEYGKSITSNLEDYLDLSKLDKVDKEKVLKESKLTSDVKNQDGKEYPDTGNYEITITYKDQKLKLKVEVKDSIAPVFNEINEVSFEQGTEFDYASVINATDLQEVTFEFDKANVNKDVTGEYIVKAIAKDKSGNEVTKDIKVIVTAKPVVEEKPSTNTGGSNVVAGSTNKPSTSGGTPNKSSTGESNSSSGGGSNSGGATPPAQQPEAPHSHTFTPYANKWFNGGDELDAWAEEYIVSQNFIYSTWGASWCSCGKVGITSFK